LHKKNTNKRLTSNFFWSVVSEGVAKSCIFITNIHLARVLGVSNFGIFSLAQTTTLYVWLIVDMGVGMYGIREIARDRANAESIANSLISLRVFSSILFFLFYLTTLFFIDMPIEMKLTFAASGIYLLSNSFYPDWVLKGLEKFKLIAFGSLITSGVFIASIFFFIKSPEDLVSAALISSISFLFGSVALITALKRASGMSFNLKCSLSSWLRHLRESVYFTVSGSFYAIYIFLPLIMLQFLHTSFEVGLFSAPYRIILAVSSAGFLISAAFYPVLADQFKNDKAMFMKTHRKLRTAMIAAGLPAAVIGTYLGADLTRLLFGEQYEGSAAAFKILVWLIPLVFVRYSYGSTFSVAGFQKTHNLVTIFGVIIIAVIGPILIQRHRATGAAEALLAAELVTVALMIVVYKIKIKPHVVQA
jgi:O-antigen/teichoic acid export membrane protein